VPTAERFDEALASTMSMNVLERTRGIGVMRAIGARNADIWQMVIVEGVSVGALSWLIGLGLSFLLPVQYDRDGANGPPNGLCC
jgi:ABC-type lipoprotein release transport system permease subunit